MKHYSLIFSILFIGILQTQAQKLNTIQSETARDLPDGWHKFSEGNVFFDVKVEEGSMVRGNVAWIDGNKYSGSLFGNIISGKGTYTWTDGSRYEGAFLNNQRHGRGTMIEVDGSKWGGKWKYNQRNGKGKAFDEQGTLIQKGVWENDEFVEEKAKK